MNRRLASCLLTPIAGILLSYFVSTSSAFAQNVYYFPQLADGGGYATTFYFTGLGSGAATVTIDLFGQNGSGIPLATNRGTASTFSLVLGSRDQLTLRTLGLQQSIQVGWARVTSTLPVGATEIFEFADFSGRVISQAGVLPASAAAASTIIVAIDGKGKNTGIALANVGASVNPVTFNLFDRVGSKIGTAGITLSPRTQVAAFIDQLPGFERISTPFEGSLEISGLAFFAPVSLLLNGIQLSTVPTFPGRTPPKSSNTVGVLGISSLWLAGSPTGATMFGGDVAPLNSPVEVGISLIPGRELEFSASGSVSGVAPAGDSFFISCGNYNGVGDIVAPEFGLVGVFLGSSQPAPPYPTTYNFDGGLIDIARLQPALQQPFYIGTGTTNNQTRRIVIPQGATRLFLAPLLCGGSNRERGEYTVTVQYAQQ